MDIIYKVARIHVGCGSHIRFKVLVLGYLLSPCSYHGMDGWMDGWLAMQYVVV